MSPTRLNKLLSQSGIASRRAADDLIRQGRVTINGQVVDQLGTKADPARDDVKVDGRRLRTVTERRYLLLNKPRGVVSTRSDPQGRPTVVDLVFQTLATIRDRGLGVLLVEQRAQRTVALADRTHVLAGGELRLTLGPDDADDTDRMVAAYLS